MGPVERLSPEARADLAKDLDAIRESQRASAEHGAVVVSLAEGR